MNSSTSEATSPTTASGAHAVVRIAGRVLVVEPDTEARRAMRRALQSVGAMVDVASNERDALTNVTLHDYCVIVTSTELPGSNAFNLIRECRKHGTRALFVLVSGAHFEAELTRTCDDLIMGILHEPVDVAELVEVVQGAAVVGASRRSSSERLTGEAFVGPILVLESDALEVGRVQRALSGAGRELEACVADRLKVGLELLRARQFGGAVVNLMLPDARGLDVVRKLRMADPDLSIVVVAGAHEDVAQQSLAVGAQEVVDPRSLASELVPALRRGHLRKNADRDVRYHATHDSLTGLLNGVRFHEQLGQAVARVRRQNSSCALLYIDLDGFKPVNDQYGHAAGDVVLCVVARRLREAIRECDTASRLGGDEFGVLLEDIHDRSAVRVVAQRVLRAVAAPVHLDDGSEVRVTASIGLALCPPATGVDKLIEAADAAMFDAKGSGRSQYCFASEPGESTNESHASLIAELRSAAAAGDFYLVYQPQVDLKTHRVVGLEALLRWRRPGRSPIGPEQFVPMLEESDLITEVGAWVLREACRHARAWAERHARGVRLAVNVSPRQLEQGGFATHVGQLLSENQLAPEQLELELTESALLRDRGAIGRSLEELRSRGVRLVLDDFGTGYASLSHLSSYPVDALKIDRSFVHPLTKEPNARVMVGGIIDLAHDLGLNVIAEGVESMAQVTYLRDRGCDACQGFLFGRPHDPNRLLASDSRLLHAR
jgi:diguanylate cyclase (GGDEF)-like protein